MNGDTPSEVLDKIAKLLSLATSSNEHEAALAASRAAELMTRWQVGSAEVAVGLDPTRDELTSETLYRVTGADSYDWRGQLMYTLAKQFQCSIYYTTAGGLGLHLVGKPTKVQALVQVYEYMMRAISRLALSGYAEAAYGRHPTETGPRQWLTSFKWGAVSTVSGIIDVEQRALRVTLQPSALARIDRDEKDTKDFMNQLRITTVRSSHRSYDSDAYRQGQRAGRDLSPNASRAGITEGRTKITE